MTFALAHGVSAGVAPKLRGERELPRVQALLDLSQVATGGMYGSIEKRGHERPGVVDRIETGSIGPEPCGGYVSIGGGLCGWRTRPGHRRKELFTSKAVLHGILQRLGTFRSRFD